MVLPPSITLKKRKYVLEITVRDEAQLASLDVFVSLALKTFYLLSPDGTSINFDIFGEPGHLSTLHCIELSAVLQGIIMYLGTNHCLRLRN